MVSKEILMIISAVLTIRCRSSVALLLLEIVQVPYRMVRWLIGIVNL